MSDLFNIPPLNWFESNPWAKVGNKYTGSVGAVGIQNNAFLYRIIYYRKDEGNVLEVEIYDSISQMDNNINEYEKEIFEGSEQGREDMIEWLELQYKEFVDSGKNKLKINF